MEAPQVRRLGQWLANGVRLEWDQPILCECVRKRLAKSTKP
jgi:hypothetical protein